MSVLALAIAMILGAILGASILTHAIDYLDARRAKKRRWSNYEHQLLRMSIKLVK